MITKSIYDLNFKSQYFWLILLVLNEISLCYAPLMIVSSQLFLQGFIRLIAKLNNIILVSFLNNSTKVNLVLFSLIDDCKSLFHSFLCKKIIHMFREANQSTDFVVFSSFVWEFLVVLIWTCLVPTIILVLCILGEQAFFMQMITIGQKNSISLQFCQHISLISQESVADVPGNISIETKPPSSLASELLRIRDNTSNKLWGFQK